VEDFDNTQGEILALLSPALRTELLKEVQCNILREVELKCQSPMVNATSCLHESYKRDLMGVMVGQVRCPDEVIFRGRPKFWYEHMEESFLFFLMKGRLMAFQMEQGTVNPNPLHCHPTLTPSTTFLSRACDEL